MPGRWPARPLRSSARPGSERWPETTDRPAPVCCAERPPWLLAVAAEPGAVPAAAVRREFVRGPGVTTFDPPIPVPEWGDATGAVVRFTLPDGTDPATPLVLDAAAGVVLAEPDFGIHNETFAQNPNCGDPAVNIELYEQINERTVAVKAELNALLADLAGLPNATASEIAAMKVKDTEDHGIVPDEPDLTSKATMGVETYLEVVAEALANAK